MKYDKLRAVLIESNIRRKVFIASMLTYALVCFYVQIKSYMYLWFHLCSDCLSWLGLKNSSCILIVSWLNKGWINNNKNCGTVQFIGNDFLVRIWRLLHTKKKDYAFAIKVAFNLTQHLKTSMEGTVNTFDRSKLNIVLWQHSSI